MTRQEKIEADDSPFDREKLERSYLATSYVVEAPAGRITMRIGQACQGIDALVASHGSRFWAFVTAHNPSSHRLTNEENQRRHDALVQRVHASGYIYFPGESIGDSGKWPAEASLFIVGIGEEEALDLARHFDQAAIVTGEIYGPPRLAWIYR